MNPREEMNPIAKKVMIVIGLTLALLYPLYQVENQIVSRQDYEGLAQKDVAASWGADVKFNSPKISLEDKTYHPAEIHTTIYVDSKEKKRGVFRVPVFLAKLTQKVKFGADAALLKATSKQDRITVNFEPVKAIQGFKIRDKRGKEIKGQLVDTGIRIPVAPGSNAELLNEEFEVEITLRGTGHIFYSSRAEQDHVTMRGNWTKPQYIEDVLPTDSKLSTAGFEATWTLAAMPKYEGPTDGPTIGLNHLWITTEYSMAERAVKYGILLIALTFLMAFIIEIMGKVQIHPFQYALIGLSLSIFYLLLLAISEVTGFTAAYIISSASVVGLITFYLHGFMKNKKFVTWMALEQVLLSVFFYVLLTLEERSLLVGSVGLFLALAALMTVTRKLDWYSSTLINKTRSEA